MSAERFRAERFEIGKRYTKAEFLFILESLIVELSSENDPLVSVLERNVEWVKGHGDKAVFVWIQRPDGYTYPQADEATGLSDAMVN